MKTTIKTFISLFSLAFILNIANISFAETGFSALIVEPSTGKVLFEHEANHKRYPASLTKMMTLYLVFEDLSKKRVSLDKRIRFSKRAAAQEPSKLGVKEGHSITLKTAIDALIIRSANDVAVAVAENISGNEAKFVARMNQTAKRLGMNSTNFTNPNGLPNLRQVSTAKDLITLSVALYNDFPQYYHLFKQDSFVYNGKEIKGHNNVNKLLYGADGIKTGYIRLSGSNLATSAERNGTRLFAVIIGGYNTKNRDQMMVDLMNDSFDALRKNRRNPRISAVITEDMLVGYDEETNPNPKRIKITNRRINMDYLAKSSPKNRFTPNEIPDIQLLSTTTDKIVNIQIGAFRNKNTAFTKAKSIQQQIKTGFVNIDSNNNIHRAQIAGIPYDYAIDACRKLISRGEQCIVLQ